MFFQNNTLLATCKVCIERKEYKVNERLDSIPLLLGSKFQEVPGIHQLMLRSKQQVRLGRST